MTYNNLHYCIIDWEDVKAINFTHVQESVPESLRRSIDGTKTFVKYEGEQPEFIFHIAGSTSTRSLMDLASVASSTYSI